MPLTIPVLPQRHLENSRVGRFHFYRAVDDLRADSFWSRFPSGDWLEQELRKVQVRDRYRFLHRPTNELQHRHAEQFDGN